MSNTNGSSASQLGELTPREREVAALIANGMSNDEIAQRLVLTSGTVANHVAHILAKSGLRSRVQVAIRYRSQRLTRSTDETLTLLARLREVGPTDLRGALQHAADVLASVFSADKVDVFLYHPAEEALVALGTSRTQLGRQQRELGLNRLPITHGGRVAWVFQNKRPYCDGHADQDAFELVGIRQGLGVRSTMAVPLTMSSGQEGVLLVSAVEAEHFADPEVQLLQFVAYWIALVAQQHAQTRANGISYQ